jgi:hypothetical protein
VRATLTTTASVSIPCLARITSRSVLTVMSPSTSSVSFWPLSAVAKICIRRAVPCRAASAVESASRANAAVVGRTESASAR